MQRQGGAARQTRRYGTHASVQKAALTRHRDRTRRGRVAMERVASSHARALTDYRPLGRSGLRVSPVCFGTMTSGEELGWGSSVQECESLLDAFFEQGGNFLDTANVYTLGHSE